MHCNTIQARSGRTFPQIADVRVFTGDARVSTLQDTWTPRRKLCSLRLALLVSPDAAARAAGDRGERGGVMPQRYGDDDPGARDPTAC
eukprot:7388742-Prymnesium_polylepis.1